MTNPEPMQGEATAPPADPIEGPSGSTVGAADIGSVASLQRSAWHASLGLAAYTAIAIWLIGWSLRRGRLSDAVLILVAMAVTLPPILSYRKQLRKRLRALAGSAATAEPGVPSAPTGELSGGPEEAEGPAASPRLES